MGHISGSWSLLFLPPRASIVLLHRDKLTKTQFHNIIAYLRNFVKYVAIQ